MNFIEGRVIEEGGSLFIMTENHKFLIPRGKRKRLLVAKNRETILGIRPEHIYDSNLKAPFPNSEKIQETVDVIEPVGADVILLSVFGSSRLTACVEPQTEAKLHDQIEFLVDMNRIHLFDKETRNAYGLLRKKSIL